MRDRSCCATNVKVNIGSYSCISGRASWEAPVKVNANVLNELIFLKENLSEMNVCSLDHVFSNENADVYVDVTI
jgi:hypothetical protein